MKVPCKEVLDYVNEIDSSFVFAKEKRMSRMNVFWGKWSREMNIRLRTDSRKVADTLGDKHPLNHLLTWCFMYWINRSQLLELHYKHPMTKYRKKRQLLVEGEKIKKTILSGDPLTPPDRVDSILKLIKR